MVNDGKEIGRRLSHAGQSLIKKIQRQDIKERPTAQYLNRLADGVDALNNVPFSNGIRVDLEIDADKSEHLIRHGLGRRIEGFIFLRIPSLQIYNIFEKTTEDPTTQLLLDTSSVTEDFTLSVWIF